MGSGVRGSTTVYAGGTVVLGVALAFLWLLVPTGIMNRECSLLEKVEQDSKKRTVQFFVQDPGSGVAQNHDGSANQDCGSRHHEALASLSLLIKAFISLK